MTTERPPDEDLPEHERRPETDVGGGLTRTGGTAPETGTDEPVTESTQPPRPIDKPVSDADDEAPEDPDGPEVAYTPRSI